MVNYAYCPLLKFILCFYAVHRTSHLILTKIKTEYGNLHSEMIVGVNTIGTDVLQLEILLHFIWFILKVLNAKFGTWTQAQTGIPFTATVCEQQCFFQHYTSFWIYNLKTVKRTIISPCNLLNILYFTLAHIHVNHKTWVIWLQLHQCAYYKHTDNLWFLKPLEELLQTYRILTSHVTNWCQNVTTIFIYAQMSSLSIYHYCW